MFFKYYYSYHRKIAKRGGEWLPLGATRGCYPKGILDLSCQMLSRKNVLEGWCTGPAAVIVSNSM